MNHTAGERPGPPKAPGRSIRVWDLPTRLFHWLLVLLVIASFITGKVGGTWMQYHKWSGYTIFALLGFRLVWGFIGGNHARFRAFVRGPAAVLHYSRTLLRREAPKHLGHNPLGGWSVIAMLTVLLVQTITGLFANDDIFTEGPLYPWVSKATSDWLTRVHKLNQLIILVLVGVHIMAVIFYLIAKHENLILPMFTGRKYWFGEGQASANRIWLAALVTTLCVLSIYLLVR